jgi:hypothetical protein
MGSYNPAEDIEGIDEQDLQAASGQSRLVKPERSIIKWLRFGQKAVAGKYIADSH